MNGIPIDRAVGLEHNSVEVGTEAAGASISGASNSFILHAAREALTARVDRVTAFPGGKIALLELVGSREPVLNLGDIVATIVAVRQSEVAVNKVATTELAVTEASSVKPRKVPVGGNEA